jgi:hypothetical protein
MAIEVIPISSQPINGNDLSLAQGFEITNFLSENSSIELNIFSIPNNEILSTEYNYKNYSPIVNQLQSGSSNSQISDISINPKEDFINYFGEDSFSAQYNMTYNFYDNVIGSNLQQLFITEISSDRTELKLDSFSLTDIDIVEQTNNFIQQREDSDYFVEFSLNFGENQLIQAVNIKLDDTDPSNPTILVKTKTPLSNNFIINNNLWIIRILEEPVSYKVTITPDPIVVEDTLPIQGPNFDLDIKNQVNNSTLPLSYLDLITTSQTSSQNQLNNLLEKKSLNINIDYTDFNNFVHFSSAQKRLNNFQYKISLLESYSSSIAVLDNTSTSTNMSSSKATFEGKIQNIINNFDGYERYLYYDTGSFSYPKTTNQIPYTIAKSNSTAVVNWLGNENENSPLYGGILSSASIFDTNNRNQLLKSIPEYLRDDPSNQLYELFVDMVAQHYDNIWIYLKDITNKYDNDNRLNFGISKDLVADAIRDFGIKLYQNNFSNDDLYTAFLGLTPEGSLFPYPNMTGSLPSSKGFEYVDSLISASNDILPQEDVNKSLYKRIYHNLPYLLNSKGTIPGLRALITSYGIPDTILRINEYGGKDKINVNDWDHWQNEFNSAFNTSGSNFISSSWALDSKWGSADNVPETMMFRFKTDGLPKTNIPLSQSLWFGDGGIGAGGTALTLRYSGSAYSSGSYSGSIKDPYYNYAYLEYYPDITEPTVTASIYYPFFDGGWWSVMLTKTGSNFELFAQNKIYEGGDNDTRIGFQTSSLIIGDETPWLNTGISYFPVSFSAGTLGGYDIVTYDDTAIYDGVSGVSSSYISFSGSYQEIRYYSTRISESVFKDYTMNPYSIEGNSPTSSQNDLAFRASIGGELYTSSISIHPKVTGSWAITQSFATGNSDFNYYISPYWVNNKEFFFIDQPVAGIKNVIGDKIRIEDNIFPTGSVLSPYKSLLQQSSVSQSYTPNINYLEVAFSPQNQINEDIMSQFGFFNLGDYIGDPRLRSSSAETYPELDKIRDEYFQKYIKNYDVKDFIRLIKFFDNSLFKMIKDFVPARTSLASGIVIKQHLLERNKYPQPQADINTTLAKYPKSGSIIYNQPLSQQNIVVSGAILPQSRGYNSGSIGKFSGGTGGVLEPFNNLTTSPYGVSGSGPENRYFLTQSFSESLNTISGSVKRVISNQDEFYDGIFSGSNLVVTTQSLADPYPNLNGSIDYKTILYSNTLYDFAITSPFAESQFLNAKTTPNDGELFLLAPRTKLTFTLGSGITLQPQTPYARISKNDCEGDDNTNVLSQLDILKVKYSGSNDFYIHDIVETTELPDSFLYRLKKGNIGTLGAGIYTEIKNYYVSSSGGSPAINSKIPSCNSTTLGSCGGKNGRLKLFTAEAGNIAHYDVPYFNTSSGFYNLENTPNIPLSITASIITSGSTSVSGSGRFSIRLLRDGSYTDIQTESNIDLNDNVTTTTISASFFPLKSDEIFFTIEEERNSAAATTQAFVKSSSILITQSANNGISASVCSPTIELFNYYNSDFNPTINNVMDNRKNTIYQNVDYSSGINFPVNFGFILSGSAEKFPIPDSHYTQKSSIIPRYEGAKSTSARLNQFTKGIDVGTYGKIATISSLKSFAAYSDWIGGYPPEHMRASGIHVQYLIDEDGIISIPNTTPNSLVNLQENFQSKEILVLNSNTIGTGDPLPTRNIIRGGYRIEPILYTQNGHSPARWDITGSFTGDFVSDLDAINDYQLDARPSSSQQFFPINNYSKLEFSQTIQSGDGASYSNSEYVITQEMIDENVTITVTAGLDVFVQGTSLGNQNYYVYGRMVRERGGVISDLGSFYNVDGLYVPNPIYNHLYVDEYNNGPYLGDSRILRVNPTSIATVNKYPALILQATLSPQNLQVGDKIYLMGKYEVGNPNALNNDIFLNPNESYIKVSQNPSPSGNIITSSGTNTLWNYPDPTKSYAISSSNPVLTDYYDKGYKMDNTSGSVGAGGFGVVALDWNMQVGDEFRFEGTEDSVFMVKKVYGLTESDSERLSNTGSVEVHFDKPISTSSINLDHFLIRRYVPDASQIIIEGFKPTNAVGPYIVKPRYLTTKLDSGISEYVTELTNKGLI